MIPAAQPHTACYKHQGEKHAYSYKPVIAWDGDGAALVVDEKSGRLRRASNWPNLHSVGPVVLPPVVAALPADGWRAVYREDDGTESEDPVFAWMVRAGGWVFPVVVDPLTGSSHNPTEVKGFIHLTHPTLAPPEAMEMCPKHPRSRAGRHCSLCHMA